MLLLLRFYIFYLQVPYVFLCAQVGIRTYVCAHLCEYACVHCTWV